MGSASSGKSVDICLQRADQFRAGTGTADGMGTRTTVAGWIEDSKLSHPVGLPCGPKGSSGRTVRAVVRGIGIARCVEPGAGKARRAKDPCAGRSGYVPSGEEPEGTSGTSPSSGERDGRSAGRRDSGETGGQTAGSARTGKSDLRGVAGDGSRAGRGTDREGKTGSAGEPDGTGSAADEAWRQRDRAQFVGGSDKRGHSGRQKGASGMVA